MAHIADLWPSAVFNRCMFKERALMPELGEGFSFRELMVGGEFWNNYNI